MAAEVSFNKKMNEVKLLLSSLFARKLNWVVFNGDDPNTLIFTSVEISRIAFYRPEIDDQMAMVKVTDDGIKYLYELFPFFRSTCGVIFLPTFLSTMNKLIAENKGVAPNVRIDLKRDSFFMDAPNSTKPEFELDENSKPTEVCVGYLTIADYYNAYKAVFAHHCSFGSNTLEKNITLGDAAKNDKTTGIVVSIPNTRFNTDVYLKLPIQDGTNIVSFTEYLSKRKAEWKYRLLIYYDERHSVAKVAYAYKDEWVDAVSITPAALWFPFKKK